MRSFLALLALLPLAISPSLADVITGKPDAAPAGYEEWVSPVVVPAPNVAGHGDWASAVADAKKLVSKMTLLEKVNVTTGQGLFGRCVGNTGSAPRVGYGGLCLQDSPLGVRFANNVSAFPAGINAASTWDTNLIYQRGLAMGQEFRGKGVNVALGPMMNMGRVAAGGRNWEGFGADPFLTGVSAAETVKGIQDAGVIACAKHFIGNEQEHFRGGSLAGQIESSDIDDKTMHELYLWPFAESVQAGVASTMCSYNKVNQTQACQNSKIINGLLKEELDFQGMIMSDWAAMIEGVQPALAGLDLDMPGFPAYGQGEMNLPVPVNATNSFWGAALVTAVQNGSVPVSRLDDMVTRQLAAFYKLGQNHGYPAVNFDVNNRPGLNLNVNVQADHFKLIRQIGAASTILLKNTASALPLIPSKLRKIGVFGADAGPNPAGPNACSDRGCDVGTLAMGWGSGTTQFPYLVDPLSAIRSFASKNCGKTTTVTSVLNEFDTATVVNVAKSSDVCLVFSNADSGEGYITVDGNAGDRNNLTLWNSGEALIKSTADNCNNTVVVLHVVGPVIVEQWIDHPNVKAVLLAGLPGQESGNAIVDVLFGAVNPSGKLAYTIAKQRGDYPDDVLYTSSMQTPQIVYKEGVNIDYKWFDVNNITPRFPFGFGLSYTTFAYSGLSISPLYASSSLYSTALTVSYTIKNTGHVDGAEVSQVYIGFPGESAPRQLRGFDKSTITKGGSKHVTVSLRVKDVSTWDVGKQKWVVPSGEFKVFVGSSSRDVKLTGSFKH